ncbi:molybdopterin-guanine dinucleotide biosynthesis protein B [Bacillus weihaiensis]|uniref:Molybdopterin-guanine dinucleotide biosynthesis protein B n=1 Tax=Bacillus weihaiensis TaxID=1547283 RepID=A0A1L3MSZ2_9BACI|nr:molybdopterin-guanine dinucleotide biosynthesis protein B [Bacillus weihaiensis]APH05468.1 molybdopterin-guanine dinucleotide biosynthesis protein B [Bacillus weihaiensis]
MGRVLQVVGYQNSGKTTFVIEYVKEAVAQKHLVGTIKHHGHQSSLAYGDEVKDTGRHRDAGATASLVEGNGSFILTGHLNMSLLQLVKLYKGLGLDIILIEGFKKEHYPKVVILRSLEDVSLLRDISNIECVVTNFQLPEDLSVQFPVFTNQKACIKWLLENKVGEDIV